MIRPLLITLILLTFGTLAFSQKPVDTAYLSVVKAALRSVWPNNRTVNIVFHGHSVPAGYGDKHEVHTLDAYPHLVLEKLKSKYIFSPINVIVTAIGGENAVKGQLRFEADVLGLKPDVILIDYSLNDRSVGLEKSKQAWEKMIEAANKRNIPVILLTPSPDQRVDIASTGNELEQHASQVRLLARKYHTGLADSFLLFRNLTKDGSKISGYMSSVNHPNRKGHEIIATEIMKWFE